MVPHPSPEARARKPRYVTDMFGSLDLMVTGKAGAGDRDEIGVDVDTGRPHVHATHQWLADDLLDRHDPNLDRQRLAHQRGVRICPVAVGARLGPLGCVAGRPRGVRTATPGRT